MNDLTYTVPPVLRAIRLLRYISNGQPLDNLSEAARVLNINRTTLFRLLSTLEAEKLIEKSIYGHYSIGSGVLELAAEYLASCEVTALARPFLNQLANRFGLSCHLAKLDQDEVIYLLRETSNATLISNIRVGARLPVINTAMGRIFLAHQPLEFIQKYSHLSDFSRIKIQSQIDKKQGYALSEGVYEKGIIAIAAPVFDMSSQVIAAINISGHESHFNNHPERKIELIQALTLTALEISQKLGFRLPLSQRRVS